MSDPNTAPIHIPVQAVETPAVLLHVAAEQAFGADKPPFAVVAATGSLMLRGLEHVASKLPTVSNVSFVKATDSQSTKHWN